MKYTVLSLFPGILDAYFATSIMAKAVKRGIISYTSINIRDFARDKHTTCDDAPYGGGAGMLMLPEPLGLALQAAGAVKKNACCDSAPLGAPAGGSGVSVTPPEAAQCLQSAGGAQETHASQRACPCEEGGTAPPPLKDTVPAGGSGGPEGRSAGGPDTQCGGPELGSGNRPPRVIYLSPSGRPLTQNHARRLARERELVLVCGRYEGIDQRIIDAYVDEEISVGDYVLSSGEVAALALIDATYRLVDEVITPESLEEESFSAGLLEYPQYTRPEIYDSMRVPELLLSGHHEQIRRWRLRKRVEKTLEFRPDLILWGLRGRCFDAETYSLIKEIEDSRNPERPANSEGEI